MASSSEATARAIDLAARLEARLLIVNVLEKRRLAGGGSHERVDQARAERERCSSASSAMPAAPA